MKTLFSGLLHTDIEKLISPLPRFRAKQIYKWLIQGISSFDQMTDIPILMQKQLNERFQIFTSSVTSIHEDKDTKKIVITLKDNSKIETVLLSDGKNRYTICITTQVGCSCGCVFCKTGSMGFIRNLDSSEIIEQFLHLIRLLNFSPDKDSSEHLIDNIVFMGMGEPLLNLENLKKAIFFLNDKQGLNISWRRITVSTCGICEPLFEIAKTKPFFRLALSLTTGDESLRNELMPITKNNPLNKIHSALKTFQNNNGGRITLEIPLLGGINTRIQDAKSIAKFAKGLDTVINIIPWNPVSGLMFKDLPLKEPEKNETFDYIRMLEDNGLKVTLRLHKGRNVLGACGQLG